MSRHFFDGRSDTLTSVREREARGDSDESHAGDVLTPLLKAGIAIEPAAKITRR
jgi:hypothetical protein